MRKTLFLLSVLTASAAFPQSRLASMPGYKEATEHRPKLRAAVKLASLPARWVDGKTLAWQEGSEWVLFDAVAGRETRQAEEPPRPPAGQRGGNRGNPGRGRQFTEVTSPDGKVTATYRDGNVFVKDGFDSYQLTEAGDLSKRMKFGSASWVYGEELGQNEAMGFSPDGSKLWVYFFDEREVKDYHLSINQRQPQSELYVEAYPKPGQPNPIVAIMIYDLKTRQGVTVNGHGTEADDPGHYQYNIRWSPDGSKLLFHRMNRRQNRMEFCASNLNGQVTVLDREDNPNGWVEQAYPTMYLDEVEGVSADLKGKALWLSERSGFCNIYVMDLEKGGVTPVTKHGFDVRRIVKFDPKTRMLWYIAANGDRPALMQLNRIKLDGTGHARLTDPAYHHDVSLSADASHFLDTAQSIDRAPFISVMDGSGKLVKTLRDSDVSGMKAAGYEPVELFRFKAADGVTELSGLMHKPVNFDPSKKYPVICTVYGGPGGPTGNSFSERFQMADTLCDYGFIVLDLENRGLGGRGRAFRDFFYRKMGITEIDDMAAGVKAVSNRPYVDSKRVGITGTSYGGYSTLMAMMRYPDIFHAGVAASCVSDWRNYDTTYTERYMGLLPEDAAGYDAGSAVKLAGNLKGWLLIYYGTSDDNTHPTNSYQVIAALQRAGKYHEVQVTPDAGHSGVNYNRMLEFFIERLVMNDTLPDGTKY